MALNVCKRFVIASFLGVIAFNSQTAHSARFSFKQAGFTGSMYEGGAFVRNIDGGIVSGVFSAEDTAGGLDDNGKDIPDGKINICNASCGALAEDRLTGFSIHFSGNSVFNSFNHLGYIALSGINYDSGTNLLELYYHTEGYHLQSYPQNILFDNGPYMYSFTTQQPLVVSSVPVPGALGLFALGIIGLLGITRGKTFLGRP